MDSNLFVNARALSRWFKTYIEKLPNCDFLRNSQNTDINKINLVERFSFYQQHFTAEIALRKLRQEHFAMCIIRDIEHNAPLSEIISTMTKFAEFVIRTAHDIARIELAERFGYPRLNDGSEAKLHIVGMGKLGGGELNVSSDIDLIFLYPDENDCESDGTKSLSASEYFTRLGKRIIALLDELTEEGRVFRVDMRLRPHGDSGPLACGFNFFENYLYQDGRDWERYAWIKGRLIVGDKNDELQNLIRPFVFRKYLDFSAVTAMHDLHQQIREQVERKEMQGNIKLGRGGIREIEFIAQVYQLMRGGRRAELQIKPTVEVLYVLANLGFLKLEVVQKLEEYYIFLRRLEHRLQYREDAQTQNLPTDTEVMKLICSSMGLTINKFNEYFAKLQNEVSCQFYALFQDEDPNNVKISKINKSEDDNINITTTTFSNYWILIEKIVIEDTTFTSSTNLKSHPLAKEILNYFSQVNIDQQLFDSLINHAKHPRIRTLKDYSKNDHRQLIKNLFAHCFQNGYNSVEQKNNNENLITRFLEILIILARRPSYLKLLTQTPSALTRLFRFLQASSWGAEYLGHHPILLDDLLDPRLLEQNFSRQSFAEQLKQGLRANMDVGEKMNWLRDYHHANVFRLLAQDLEGILSVEKLADHLSDCADEILQTTLDECWQAQKKRSSQNMPETPKVAIIAYGKLGGKELGYASDLDLVIIHDDENSDNFIFYHKTALSLTHWLSSTTETGTVFETDYRLRPDGDAGVMVPSLSGFAQYQKTKSWVWEHQALTRARFCAGDKKIGEKFEKLRREILCMPREREKLKNEIILMREKISATHINKSLLFDIKHDKGGLVDIEFIVQFQVLLNSINFKELTLNKGNIALLLMLGERNLIPDELAKTCSDAYREYRRIQHQCRLNHHKYSRVEKSTVSEYQKAVIKLWQAVFTTNQSVEQ